MRKPYDLTSREEQGLFGGGGFASPLIPSPRGLPWGEGQGEGRSPKPQRLAPMPGRSGSLEFAGGTGVRFARSFLRPRCLIAGMRAHLPPVTLCVLLALGCGRGKPAAPGTGAGGAGGAIGVDGPAVAPEPAASDADAGPALPDGAGGGVGEPDAAAPFDPALPRIHDHSGAPAGRVLALVRAALAGLGFDPARGEGPNPDDRVFVGRHYLAWIDQTGFYGKMNGLWTLNGAEGEALDFVLVDGPGAAAGEPVLPRRGGRRPLALQLQGGRAPRVPQPHPRAQRPAWLRPARLVQPVQPQRGAPVRQRAHPLVDGLQRRGGGVQRAATTRSGRGDRPAGSSWSTRAAWSRRPTATAPSTATPATPTTCSPTACAGRCTCGSATSCSATPPTSTARCRSATPRATRASWAT